MGPTERWTQIREVLAGALELPSGERRGFVTARCQGDPELEAEVQALVAADEGSEERSAAWVRSLEGLTAALAGDEDDVLPAHIGRYPVLEELGRGGTGAVYRAYDPKLDRAVAIKVFSPAWLGRGEIPRVLREARSLARFNHPHIASIYALDETPDGRSFLVLELVDGETLAQRLRRGTIELPEALRIGAQIARALAAAHQRGIVHRDLKPQNVMLDLEGTVKVLDFGIAQTVGEASTRERDIIGTLGYMSPEQILGRVLDARSDVFSFGLVLYECLTGARALEGSTVTEVRESTLAGRIAWELLPDDLPAEVRQLLAGCLALERNERTQDMGDLASALEGIRRSLDERSIPVAAARSVLLPRPLSSFVGRERERAEICGALAESRLLTLTGPGGVGKSRLALEVARELGRDVMASPTGRTGGRMPAPEGAVSFFDGVVWVSLASLSTGDQLIDALVAELGLSEADGRPLPETLRAGLAWRELLLVLDGCDHVGDACAELLGRLLPDCPRVRVLATSLGRLVVPGERTYAVPPLRPDDALALFAQRAREARPGFRLQAPSASVVLEICRRLDGLPLAIELAAARVRAMSVAEILRRIDETTAHPRSGFVTAFDWGYDLLGLEAQQLLLRLSVFAGGWSLESAEVVCADATIAESEILELLSALVEKSFVVYEFDPNGDREGRYRMLGTIRQYARRRFEAEDAETRKHLLQRHLEHYVGLAERAGQSLNGPEQQRALDILESEHENLLAAFGHAVSGSEDVLGLRLALALSLFWQHRAHYGIARASLERALAVAPQDGSDALRSRAELALGRIAAVQGRRRPAQEHYDTALALAQKAGEEPTVAAIALDRAMLALGAGEWEAAQALIAEAEAIYAGGRDQGGLARAASLAAAVAHYRGELGEARASYERALGVYRKLGDRHGIAGQLNGLADIVLRQGDLDRAEAMYAECLAIAREQNLGQGMAATLTNLANVASMRGDSALALARIEEALVIARRMGHRKAMASALAALASYRVGAGDPQGARGPAAECLDIAVDLGLRFLQTHAVFTAGQIAAAAGDASRASAFFAAAENERRTIGVSADPRQRVGGIATVVGGHAAQRDDPADATDQPGAGNLGETASDPARHPGFATVAAEARAFLLSS